MILLLLLILLLIPQTEKPEVFNCTVKARNRVECPGLNSGTLIFKNLNWDMEPYSEWTWKVERNGIGEPDLNMPMFRQQPKVGQQLRAKFTNGILVPLKGCEETVHDQVNDASRACPGCKLSFTLWEKPKDCGGGR